MKKFFILTLAIGATLTSCRKDWISPDDLASIEAGYNTRITALTADLAAATTEVAALEGTITTLESTIADLEANGTASAETIATLQAQVSAELVKVATLQAEVAALEIALADSSTDANELADQIEILNEEIDELKEEVLTLTEEALVKDALIAQLELDIEELEGKLDEVFALFDSTTASSTIADVKALVEALQATDLEKDSLLELLATAIPVIIEDDLFKGNTTGNLYYETFISALDSGNTVVATENLVSFILDTLIKFSQDLVPQTAYEGVYTTSAEVFVSKEASITDGDQLLLTGGTLVNEDGDAIGVKVKVKTEFGLNNGFSITASSGTLSETVLFATSETLAAGKIAFITLTDVEAVDLFALQLVTLKLLDATDAEEARVENFSVSDNGIEATAPIKVIRYYDVDRDEELGEDDYIIEETSNEAITTLLNVPAAS